MIEVNFLGQDPDLHDPSESYPFGDDVLPLMVFGSLSRLGTPQVVDVDGMSVPVPLPSGLLIEKLATDRTGLKGDRDLLVALGLLLVSSDEEISAARRLYSQLPMDLRHSVRTNLGILGLLPAIPGVPPPISHRARVAAFLASLSETS